jgi:AraC family transcriptional regulator of arabinose operon
VATPGELASLVLRRARLDLDLTLARRTAPPVRADAEVRLALAVRYLEHHPAERDPIAKLCEYLQVSPGTLKTLFQRQLGLSPRDYALQRRMDHARRRLADGALVKEVATELGYRHANDLSRAYARHFGTGIREMKRRC